MDKPVEVINENGTLVTLCPGDFYGRNIRSQLQLQFVEPEDGRTNYINLSREQVGKLVDALMDWLNEDE